MKALVTRPREDSGALVDVLRDRGIEAVVEPLLALRLRDDPTLDVAGVQALLFTSANAVRTQVWTALIAMLLLRYLQLRAKFGWSLSNLAALLRQQLFVHRDLWQWLDEPFQPPPGLPQTAIEQLALPWAARR